LASLRLFILALGHLLQPLAKRPFSTIRSREFSLGERVQGFDLPRDNANNDPGVANFNKDDAFSCTQHQPADNFHGASVAETPSAIELAQKIGANKQEANDQHQAKQHLEYGGSRYTGGLRGSCLGPRTRRKHNEHQVAETAFAQGEKSEVSSQVSRPEFVLAAILKHASVR